ncbi:MAG: hypothetical protein ABIJ72_01325 [bacterium]
MSGKKISGNNLSRADKWKEKKIKNRITNKNLIPEDLENTLDSDGIDEVLWELKNINYCKFPNATADMLRTFLEIVLRQYLKKLEELPSSGRNGFVGFEAVLNKTKSVLVQKGDVGMSQVVKKLIEDKWYLDAINHNPDIFADEKDVENIWKRMSSLIYHIFKEFK